MPAQPVLAPLTAHLRAVTWRLRPAVDGERLRARLAALPVAGDLVVGLGAPAAALLGLAVSGLRPFPALAGPGVSVPSTQGALWTRVSGEDPGGALHATRALEAALADVLVPEEAIAGFCHAGGRDLTGYVDGTENPRGDAAAEAALRPDGSAFVAVQPWVHDLARFEAQDAAARDATFGRTHADDRELPDAPASAHVKRTAQESFSPPAWLVRRSAAFADGHRHGLLFLAFCRDLDAFEAPLRRMAGLEDGVVDALFRFSTPVGGGYYWVPPVADGRLGL